MDQSCQRGIQRREFIDEAGAGGRIDGDRLVRCRGSLVDGHGGVA